MWVHRITFSFSVYVHMSRQDAILFHYVRVIEYD